MIYDIHNWYSAGRFLVLSLKIERLIIVLQLIDLVVADRINIVHELQMKDYVPVIRMKKEKKIRKRKEWTNRFEFGSPLFCCIDRWFYKG